MADKMSLIHEYGERKEAKGRLEGIEEGRLEGIEEGRLEGIRSIILKFYDSGMLASEISERSGINISEVNDIVESK